MCFTGLSCLQVHIQKSMTRLATGSALFFEFMHYKERKSMDSCKAYCFIEYDEMMSLQPGNCALEVRSTLRHSCNQCSMCPLLGLAVRSPLSNWCAQCAGIQEACRLLQACQAPAAVDQAPVSAPLHHSQGGLKLVGHALISWPSFPPF